MNPRWRRSYTRPNFGLLDLFAGCGGLTEGLVSVRNRPGRLIPVGAVELDPDAAATYAANFGPHVFQGDIADWIGTSDLSADIVAGGPPCQGFSSLGNRNPDDDRNKLWARYVEVVASIRPAYFVLENVVPFLRSPQYQALVDSTERRGALVGYEITAPARGVVATDFGAAQSRPRAVIIGRRLDMPAVDLTNTRYARRERTTREAIGDLVRRPALPTKLPDSTIEIELANRTVAVRGVFRTQDLHLGRDATGLSLDRYKAIPPGGNRHDIPDELLAPCWRDHDAGSHDVMGRLHWDKPSVTIRTEFWKPEKGRYLHPELHRPITHMEAARLQGFPDDFRWCGSKASIGRQIGNAVPIPLGYAIGAALLDGLAEAGVHPRRTS